MKYAKDEDLLNKGFELLICHLLKDNIEEINPRLLHVVCYATTEVIKRA